MTRAWLTTFAVLALAACDDDSTKGGGRGTPDASTLDDGSVPSDDASYPPAASAEECFEDLSAPKSGWVEVQRFKTEDESLRIWRARERIDAPTVGETFAYKLERVWVEGGDEEGACIRDARALDYQYARHNWDETWKATTNSAVYVGKERFVSTIENTAWEDSLTVTDLQGNTILGPFTLVDDGCLSLPYDLNVCVWRMRVDEPPDDWGQ